MCTLNYVPVCSEYCNSGNRGEVSIVSHNICNTIFKHVIRNHAIIAIHLKSVEFVNGVG